MIHSKLKTKHKTNKKYCNKSKNQNKQKSKTKTKKKEQDIILKKKDDKKRSCIHSFIH